MRLVAVFTLIIMLCSCSSSEKKPPVITDGFSCTVTADYGDLETEFSLKKEGTSTRIEYVSPPEIKGLIFDISPAGHMIEFRGLSHVLSDDALAMSVNGALISALDFDYSAADYSNGEYTCGFGESEFAVTAFSDGRISTVNFPKFNCTCYFNY